MMKKYLIMSLAALTLISMGAKAQGNSSESGEMMTYTGTIRKAPRFSPKRGDRLPTLSTRCLNGLIVLAQCSKMDLLRAQCSILR